MVSTVTGKARDVLRLVYEKILFIYVCIQLKLSQVQHNILGLIIFFTLRYKSNWSRIGDLAWGLSSYIQFTMLKQCGMCLSYSWHSYARLPCGMHMYDA